MKGFMLFITVTVASAAFAQTKQYFQPNYDRFKSFVKPAPAPLPQVNNQWPKNLNIAADTAQYAGSNTLGDLYYLPQDNMPMLKPYNNGATAMPGTQIRGVVLTKPNVPAKIPNAISPKKLVLPAPTDSK